MTHARRKVEEAGQHRTVFVVLGLGSQAIHSREIVCPAVQRDAQVLGLCWCGLPNDIVPAAKSARLSNIVDDVGEDPVELALLPDVVRRLSAAIGSREVV